ncbi:MAG: FHA domain-containing protein [Candidatus Nitrotoga sp.]
MAAKLMLSMDGVVLQEYALDKERMTIGRRPSSEIVIDNIAVSGEHAAIVTILNDSFLEDLDSTNGTLVNDVAIKRHFLQNNDVIEIGKYKLKYLNDQQSPSTAADFEKTMVFRASPRTASSPLVKADPYEMTEKINPTEQPQSAPAEKAPELLQAEAATSPQPALVPSADIAPDAQQAMGVIQILTGPNAGKELELVKNLTTVGKAGLQVVVFTRRPRGYFVTHVEGVSYPNLNGKPLDDQPCQLNEHDIIELAGIKMEFYFKS